MACRNCTNGNYCKFHIGSTKLATGLQYSKPFRVFDLSTGTIKSMELREQDRRNNPYIELEEKTATCTKCRKMDDCTNYFITSRSGSANVCICNFCITVQFANEKELFTYVKHKLLNRYHGSDPQLLSLLKI